MYEPLRVQLTHILKTNFSRGNFMSKRTVCLILGLFLLSYIPATDFFDDSEESFGATMEDKIERIEIAGPGFINFIINLLFNINFFYNCFQNPVSSFNNIKIIIYKRRFELCKFSIRCLNIPIHI